MLKVPSKVEEEESDKGSEYLDDEERVDMEMDSNGEWFETHKLTKEECEEIGALGTRMGYEDRCHITFNVEGEIHSIRIVKSNSEEDDADDSESE